MEYQISLAQRDLQFIQISEEIKNKKKLLLKKNKELEKDSASKKTKPKVTKKDAQKVKLVISK